MDIQNVAFQIARPPRINANRMGKIQKLRWVQDVGIGFEAIPS
jgi:hypothetical protein